MHPRTQCVHSAFQEWSRTCATDPSISTSYVSSLIALTVAGRHTPDCLISTSLPTFTCVEGVKCEGDHRHERWRWTQGMPPPPPPPQQYVTAPYVQHHIRYHHIHTVVNTQSHTRTQAHTYSRAVAFGGPNKIKRILKDAIKQQKQKNDNNSDLEKAIVKRTIHSCRVILSCALIQNCFSWPHTKKLQNICTNQFRSNTTGDVVIVGPRVSY